MFHIREDVSLSLILEDLENFDEAHKFLPSSVCSRILSTAMNRFLPTFSTTK